MAPGHRKRVRERIEREGIHSLLPHEQAEYFLTMFIPRRETNTIAHELLNRYGSLSQALEQPAEELATVPGIGMDTARRLTQYPLTVPIYLSSRYKERYTFKSHEEIEDFCHSMLVNLPEETALLIALDAQNKLLRKKTIRGVAGGVLLEARQVIDFVSAAKATRFVLAHNHPAGVASASNDDLVMTESIRKALDTISVEFVDHYIVADGAVVSLRGIRPQEFGI